jgi:DNA sulfur modification protein DndC
VPKLGKIHVGDWNDDVTSALEVTGLRNPAWEDFAETCGPGLRTLASGRAVIDVEGDSEIDEEGAWLFLDFELDRMLKDRRTTEGYWTAGYETYLSFGWSSRPKASRRASTRSCGVRNGGSATACMDSPPSKACAAA